MCVCVCVCIRVGARVCITVCGLIKPRVVLIGVSINMSCFFHISDCSKQKLNFSLTNKAHVGDCYWE